ncbi:Adenylate cyclase [Mycena chlorophos]|uniref:Adenylate cyclase n=1 Tax=Mycena chlorophos TaxID=658473 RepID=A0A8H6VTF4_MYCCL|nr:Adenylate cyclase [Mycena chlorophos]
MSRIELATRNNGHGRGLRLDPGYYPQDADIAPWLESLDEVPPTPPPKPYSTGSYSLSPQGSLESLRKGSMATTASYLSHRPSTNLSISTNESLGLDVSGQAHIPPELDLPPIITDADIAPWLDEPPSPPPKGSAGKGGFHFPHQAVLHLIATRIFVGHSLADSVIASTSTSMMHEPRLTDSPELGARKPKTSGFISSIRKKESKRNLQEPQHPSLAPPPVPNSASFLPVPSPPPTPRVLGLLKKGSRHQNDATPVPRADASDGGDYDMIKLDTNFDDLISIVNTELIPTEGVGNPASPSDSSGIGSTHRSHSEDGSGSGNGGITSRDPFALDTQLQQQYPRKSSRKVSPNTLVPPEGLLAPMTPGTTLVDESWTAPESWSVAVKDEKDGLIVAAVGGGDSDSDDEKGKRRQASRLVNGVPRMSLIPPNAIIEHPEDGATALGVPIPPPKPLQQNPRPNHTQPSSKRTSHSHTHTHSLKMRIRIYKADNTYHVVSVGSNVTVGQLTPKLDLKLPAGEEKEMHQLCLRERGRDLSGRSLRTIPVVLHQHADSIVSLRLSRNPMIEIPLDFIQSCTTLRELRLSHMAMKKVPHSLRHSSTLTRLDLSCNRIATLDEAYLDEIPGLTTLYVQNNRLERLPWNFPRMRRLITLNISNNKFRTFPKGVSDLTGLRDLDISFNLIAELPEDVGKLAALERLVIVGNRVTRLPDEFSQLGSLSELDCRRNQIGDLTVASMLPKLETLSADHNALHDLAMSVGPCLTSLDASHNEITQLSIVRGPVGRSPLGLTSLDLSNAKLSLLDEYTLSQLTALRKLKLDCNEIRVIPESLGELRWLEFLSCADNALVELPASIGRLQKLEVLDVHNNSLRELPVGLWNCASLTRLNVTSNLLVLWHDPPPPTATPVDEEPPPFPDHVSPELSSTGIVFPPNRKPSVISLDADIPPLAHSLESLYLGENRFTDEVLLPLMLLKELRVLNLSFNDIQDMPPTFFRRLTKLEEVYLSGNALMNIPSEDLPKLTRLTTLFLNGNRLQTLPQELGKVKSLTILDVGSNLLKYNINNWEFDWNWNFNKNLRYLNLSGNKRLQIKSDYASSTGGGHRQSLQIVNRESLAGFSELSQLRVLGLMDVTITTTGSTTDPNRDIPDENDDRRVRTSSSVVNGMSYGIADTLGRNQHVNMLDLVHEFRGANRDAVFAMFGRALPPKQLPAATTSNWFAKYLQENFVRVFVSQLAAINRERGEDAKDALRRAFLKLNQELHDLVFSPSARKMSHSSVTSGGPASHIDPSNLRSGASGVVVYIVDRKMYVANAGNALAVISRERSAVALSCKHDPYDRLETERVRSTEGWVSPTGLVNDELDISRSFGFFHLMPSVNARPNVQEYDLTELDEFVIIANRGLWDYVSYQTAVDIAHGHEPMVAAQKLRDFAISYGAEGCTMIMVIGVSDLFQGPYAQSPAPLRRPKRPVAIADRTIDRLKDEVPPPTGHIALVFTDIRGSTHLWDANPGMNTAMRVHNKLLRRYLRLCGGYEVKTEGDSFMVSFPTTLAAVWWCMVVQIELLNETWPLEILECADGRTITDDKGEVIARGLSVRMGIHCGVPLCEADPITNRMDYFGPMVNRSSRIEGSAAGGQIMCSTDVIREINAKIFERGEETEHSDAQPQEAVDAIRRLDPVIVPVGEVKLKGLEVPEMLSLVFPRKLLGRKDMVDDLSVGGVDPTSTASSRVRFSVDQMRELGMLALRLEMGSSGRVFRPLPERKASLEPEPSLDEDESDADGIPLHGDANVLLPPMTDKMSDSELMLVLYSLMVRVENAEIALRNLLRPPAMLDPHERRGLVERLRREAGLDERTLDSVLAVLRGV